MKKLLTLITIVFSFTLLSFTAAAKNQVINIDADIIINDDGSADIYQTWQCNFSQDTEVYYFFPDEGRYEISNLVVISGNVAIHIVCQAGYNKNCQRQVHP